MSVTNKINNQAYIDLGKDDFGSFGTNVAEKGVKNPIYAEQESAIKEVETTSGIYNVALSAFNSDGGKDRTNNLFNARKDLTAKLKALTKLLEDAAPSKPDPEAFLTGLGFTLAKVPSRRTGVVKPPICQTVVSGGKDASKGVVKFVLKAEVPDEIVTIVGKRSEDGGLTWENGIVATKMAFVLTDQPSGKDCIFQYKFLATNNRESLWSGNIAITVY